MNTVSRRWLMCIPFLMAACPLPGDEIRLQNGDRLTVGIVRKDGNDLVVKDDVLGELLIPWDSVLEATSDGPLVVVLSSGRSVTGRVTIANSELRVATRYTTEAAPMGDVTTIRNAEEQVKYERRLHPGPLSLWTGALDVGFALARGNTRTDTLTTGMTLSRVTHNDKTTAYLTQLYSTSGIEGRTVTTASIVRGGWGYSHDITPRWIVTAFNDYEYNRFQDLDLRFVIGGGLGYILQKTERSRLDLVGGADYNRETYSTGLTRNFAEAFFGDNWTYKVSPATNVTQSFRIFPNLTSTGDYRMTFDLTAATALRNWLSFQVTASDRFFTNPPLALKRNDLLLTTGFRLTFPRQ